MMQKFFRNSQQKNFSSKIGHFGFFQLINNYAETALLIDKIFISQETSYAAQQSLTRLKSSKTSKKEKKKFSLDSH